MKGYSNMSKKEIDNLKNQCKCGSNCGCHEKSEGNGYYMAVIDLTFHKVHYDVFNKQYVYSPANEDGSPRETEAGRMNTIRFYNETFSRSIKDAVVKALRECQIDDPAYGCSSPETTPLCSTFDPKNLMEHIEYNPETECFVFESFMTMGTRKYPKNCQWNKFFAGEYEFFVGRYEIQILKTELPIITDGILKDVSEAVNKEFGTVDPIEVSAPTKTIVIID